MRDNITEIHHFHSCMNCGNIWDHDPPDFDISEKDFDELHTCNLCRSQSNCDIALHTREEAEELATKGYVTIRGRRYYADNCL